MPGFDGIEQDAAQGQQHCQFPDSHIQGIEPKAAADVEIQFPAYQKGIEYKPAEPSVTPADLKDIFMNYYTRGEGLLGNTENTYPNDNESNFIVPGREGLLKITLPQEFNNSSYVT